MSLMRKDQTLAARRKRDIQPFGLSWESPLFSPVHLAAIES